MIDLRLDPVSEPLGWGLLTNQNVSNTYISVVNNLLSASLNILLVICTISCTTSNQVYDICSSTI